MVEERKNIELKEQTEFLNQQIQNNKESEFMIAELNGQISKVRGLLTRYTEEIQLKANDLITMRRQLQHDTNTLQQMRQKNQKLTIEYDAKTKQIAKIKEIVDNLASKVGTIRNEKDNAEDRLRHLDELFEDEEKSIHAIELEMARLSQMVYRSSQIIQQQHNEQKLIEVSGILNAHAHCKLNQNSKFFLDGNSHIGVFNKGNQCQLFESGKNARPSNGNAI